MKINILAVSQKTEKFKTEDLNIMSGRYAGTCYAADGYETIKQQPDEKALKRAEQTARNGHHSVFGHNLVTLEIQDCPKIIAMLLNSIGVSNTSEKSARYTIMEPKTALEKENYQKWHDIFVREINKIYPDTMDEKTIDKLAYENARYMISVFTPTSMVYSIPYRNLFYIHDWASEMYKTTSILDGSFNQRLSKELLKLIDCIADFLPENTKYLKDNKNQYFRFMPYQATGAEESLEKEYLGDVYSVSYLASFAAIAQEQRHRTVRIKINHKGENQNQYGFFVPAIIRKDDMLTQEWLADLNKEAEQGI